MSKHRHTGKLSVDLERPRVCPRCKSSEHVVDRDISGYGTGPGGRHRLGDPYTTYYKCSNDGTTWGVGYYPHIGSRGYTETERRVVQEPK